MNKNLFSILAICAALITVSFSSVKSGHETQDHYSIDELPPSWKSNNSLINAIDFILPNTVPELERSISCVNCEAPYTVSLLIDSPIILNQKVEDLSGKKRAGGFNYECVTTFAFKSSLAVYDYNRKGIAKVQVTSDTEHEFTVKKKFNLYSKDGAQKLTTEQFMAQNPSEVGPSQDDMIKFAEKRMYRLKDEISKLIKRH